MSKSKQEQGNKQASKEVDMSSCEYIKRKQLVERKVMQDLWERKCKMYIDHIIYNEVYNYIKSDYKTVTINMEMKDKLLLTLDEYKEFHTVHKASGFTPFTTPFMYEFLKGVDRLVTYVISDKERFILGMMGHVEYIITKSIEVLEEIKSESEQHYE